MKAVPGQRITLNLRLRYGWLQRRS